MNVSNVRTSTTPMPGPTPRSKQWGTVIHTVAIITIIITIIIIIIIIIIVALLLLLVTQSHFLGLKHQNVWLLELGSALPPWPKQKWLAHAFGVRRNVFHIVNADFAGRGRGPARRDGAEKGGSRP
jgi:hypothetical protein